MEESGSTSEQAIRVPSNSTLPESGPRNILLGARGLIIRAAVAGESWKTQDELGMTDDPTVRAGVLVDRPTVVVGCSSELEVMPAISPRCFEAFLSSVPKPTEMWLQETAFRQKFVTSGSGFVFAGGNSNTACFG